MKTVFSFKHTPTLFFSLLPSLTFWGKHVPKAVQDLPKDPQNAIALFIISIIGLIYLFFGGVLFVLTKKVRPLLQWIILFLINSLLIFTAFYFVEILSGKF